jgi:hypothetical protein
MHPENWNPAWTVETILTGFLSFMTSDEYGSGSLYHGISPDSEERSRLAKESKRWNSLECPSFAEDFPDLQRANIQNETFTEDEMEKCLENLEQGINEPDTDTSQTEVSGQEVLLDTSYESFVNEDWEKFGSMEEDVDYYDDGEDDIEMEDEEYDTSDTEMDVERKD